MTNHKISASIGDINCDFEVNSPALPHGMSPAVFVSGLEHTIEFIVRKYFTKIVNSLSCEAVKCHPEYIRLVTLAHEVTSSVESRDVVKTMIEKYVEDGHGKQRIVDMTEHLSFIERQIKTAVQELPQMETTTQHTNVARDCRCPKCNARMALFRDGKWGCGSCYPTTSAKGET
jgi:hypothetical protein